MPSSPASTLFQSPSSQHSPQRGPTSPDPASHNSHTTLQNIPPVSRDTTPVATAKPCTPPATASSTPPTPPDSMTRSTSSGASSVSLASALSPIAPQFQTRIIDSPIDLTAISMSSSSSSAGSVRGPDESGGGDVLDVSQGTASLQEGLTPTQESFPIKRTALSPTQVSVPSSPSLMSESPALSTASDDFRTPNVYINGLPPNFPEEQLLAMTSEFGEVISVRTFTRHVSDKPSGYGFVLFNSVDSAEKCIDTLRKYRNLHPSFSKQVHKIPGTLYASASPDLPQATNEPPDSFKSRMERLKDTSSTNLYMEGLPLSIDEPTLSALVSPYRIMSSRFFQTRLSNPPRIIAFVRLETRTAAEEVIERLHGRMVRGWRDAGSRISVRFADTSEQRELRRVERTSREGESNSPARLTMAQAALLNLKGTQLHPGAQAPRLPSPNYGMSPAMRSNRSLTPEFSPSLPPPIGLHQLRDQPLDVPALSSAMRNVHLQQYDGLNAQAADFAAPDLRMPPHMLATDPAISHEMLQMAMGLGAGTPATRAQHGFTAMEQLLLQVHARRQEAQMLNGARPEFTHRLARGSEFNTSAPEFNPSATTLGRLQGASSISARQNGARLMDYLPPMSEEDFHAAARGNQQASNTEANVSPMTLSPQSERNVSRLTLDEASRASFTRQRNQTHAEARAQAQAEQAQTLHTRSTTVPSHYLSTDRSGTQTLLNPRTNNISMNQSSTNSNAANTLNGLSSISKNISYSTHTVISNTPTSNSTLINPGANATMKNSNISKHSNINDVARDSILRAVGAKNIPASVSRARADSHQQHARIDTGAQTGLPRNGHADDEDDGSGLDSPALSYTARTPASLSPATPFSAFGDTFDGPPMTAVKVASADHVQVHEVGFGHGVTVGLAGIQQKTQVRLGVDPQTHASN